MDLSFFDETDTLLPFRLVVAYSIMHDSSNEAFISEEIMSINIHPVPAFSDNYIWTIHNDNLAVVVDPGDFKPIDLYLSENQLRLDTILLTHHHHDHIGGVKELKDKYGCEVIGPSDSRIKFSDRQVNESDQIFIEPLDLKFKVMETPGHTSSHICFFNDHWLFCGDTLFSVGCGRMFEGTAEQYVKSLHKIKSLDSTIKVFCTHEYTQSNIKFALQVEPQNKELRNYSERVDQLRSLGCVSLPTDLSTELQINPFLRVDNFAVQQQVAEYWGKRCNDDVSCFALMRKWKDLF